MSLLAPWRRPSTWWTLCHLTTDLWVAMASFTAVVTLGATSLGMLITFLGILVRWGLVRATSADLSLSSVAIPPIQLTVLVVVGAVVGVLAAVRPARRAARLDVLQALATS